MMDESLLPLSDAVKNRENVEVRDPGRLTTVYCPECDSMVTISKLAVEAVPDRDHVVHVGYAVSCDHEFTPEEAVDAHRERYDYTDGFAFEVDEE